jgi:hypothetical protein
MSNVHTYEDFLNEGYSSADKNALTKQIVSNLNDATLKGNLKNIVKVELVSFDTIEIEMEFEAIQLKISSVRPK